METEEAKPLTIVHTMDYRVLGACLLLGTALIVFGKFANALTASSPKADTRDACARYFIGAIDLAEAQARLNLPVESGKLISYCSLYNKF